jgi:SAM-dependent methyltransferase
VEIHVASTFIAKGAQGYDGYMGRWSRRLAPLFLDFSGIADSEKIVDVGCGTGALTFAIADRANITEIQAIDYEEQFVDALREQNSDPRIVAQRGDATELPFNDRQFDRALSLLVLHFVSDAPKAIAEMKRVVRPGGFVAAAVWDLFGGMPSQRIFWDTLCAIEPNADERRGMASFRPMTSPGDMKSAFGDAGLTDLHEAMLPIRMDFADFDDYWQPLIHGQGTLAALLASLPAAVSDRAMERTRAAYLCARPDGPRSFVSVAWAVRGRVPR